MSEESSSPTEDSDVGDLARWLRDLHKDQAQWDAMGRRIELAALSLPLLEGSYLWLARRLSEGSPGSPTYDQVGTLLSALVHEDVREGLRLVAPDLVDDVELWSYRLSAAIEPMHDLFGQGRDWLRVNVEYLRSLGGGVLPYRAQLVTYMRNGQDLTIETTPSGLAKYARILIDELIDIPEDAQADIEEDELRELAESGQRLQAKFKR